MKIWNQAPLVRLLIPFLFGIICAIYYPHYFKNSLVYTSLLFIILGAITLIPKFNLTYKKSHWFGFLINLLLFVFAYQITIYNTQKYSPSHFSHFYKSNDIIYARLTDSYIEKGKSLKTVIEVLSIENNGHWRKCSGKAMLYLEKDSAAMCLKYGDELLVKTNFYNVPSVQNPGEFDYKRFLSFHNIYQQGYASKTNWKPLRQNSGNSIFKYSISLRNSLIAVFKTNHLTGNELSVGAALLLGYTDKLDAELIAAYSNTGALHVLSVSGLHVAIVYIVFNWFLFFLDKNKQGKLLKAALLILFLWFYAALTGLSPSVLRSATMFSFIVVAKALNKHTNIYNTLAASAFFLLLVNPFLIMDVGFQLSYIAVIGIVYMQPKIQEWFDFDNWLITQIWTITAVSIAAQMATFPLGLYYFHQFPNYFLLSNLIVIPISTIIIYVGIAFFVLARIPILVKYVAIVFTWLIWFLNASVKWLESLPFSLLQGVSISALETLLLYVFIILILFYLNNRKYKYLKYSLWVCIAILVSQLIEQTKEYHQKKIIVYNISKTSAVDFINAKSNYLIADSSLAIDNSKLLFHIKHNWWDLGVVNNETVLKNTETKSFKNLEGFIQFFDRRIMRLKTALQFKNNNTNQLKLDYLIISNNAKMSISEINRMFKAKKIIFDSSNSSYQLKKWKQECLALKQPYYSVTDDGALEIEI